LFCLRAQARQTPSGVVDAPDGIKWARCAQHQTIPARQFAAHRIYTVPASAVVQQMRIPDGRLGSAAGA
jgi:hypothetical protein